MILFFCLIAGYIAGSCPTGYIVAEFIKGVDIRNFGSGNIGATNAGRLLGRKWAVGIALFDMLKGGIMVLIVSLFTNNAVVLSLTGAAAVIGHNFPVWLNFRGGKGVATTFGVFAFYDFFNPMPALLGGVVWYFTMKKTKYVSIASMCGIFAATLLMPAFHMPRPYWLVAFCLFLLSVYRHKTNIERIKQGSEVKVK